MIISLFITQTSSLVLVISVLMLFHEGTQLAYLIVPPFVEVKPVSLPISDLKEIVVKRLFYDSYLGCRGVQVHVDHFILFVNETCV